MIPNPQPGAGTRDEFCRHYGDCLDRAARRNWTGFTCGSCPVYGTAREAPEDTVLRSQRQATVPPVAQVVPDARLRVSLPRSEVEKEATAPVAVAPPPATARRELVATAARRQPPPLGLTEGDRIRAIPLDGAPRRRPRKIQEKPMPLVPTTALERMRALKLEQLKLEQDLRDELKSHEARAAEIRQLLGETPAPAKAPARRPSSTAKVARRKNAGTPKAKRPGAPPKPGSMIGRVREYLAKHGPTEIASLAEALDLDRRKLGVTVATMAKAGKYGVRRCGPGKYEAA